MKDTVQQISKEKKTTALFFKLSSGMLRAPDMETFLQTALVDMGNALHVHRVYIFSFDGKIWQNTYSWVDPRLPPFTDLLEASTSLQDALYADGLFISLTAGIPYVIRSVDRFKDLKARATLKQESIASLIIVPLFSNGKLLAFFGIDQCFGIEDDGIIEDWADNTLRTMITLGHLLNNAIHYYSSLQILEKKEQEAQELLDMLPFPMYISDPVANTVLFHNKAFSEYLKIQKNMDTTCSEKIVGCEISTIFCNADQAQLLPSAEPVVRDFRDEVTGMDFKVIDSCFPWGDLEIARCTIAIDITDSLRIQRERVLDKESTKAKSLFLANMSHELRTPLNGIIGMTQLALKHNENSNVQGYLEKAYESSKNLLEVINSILDFSKIEAGKLELEEQPFNPHKLCLSPHENLGKEAHNKGLELKCTIDEAVPSVLMGDALRFLQIIQCLVKNAIKFTEKGYIHVSLALCTEQGHENLPPNVKRIHLDVEDTGIGMPKEVLENLFTEFMQVDSSSTRRYGGTGLGLTIVEGLLVLMGGRISVKSTVGQGSTFTCCIPFRITEDEVSLEDYSQEDISGTRILLAEDNEINAIIAQEVLAQMGCSVDWVQDGFLALQKLESNSYDLVLMDVHMPNMDGIEATKRIRSKPCFDTLPIVALTAHILSEEIDKCYAAGMQDHALKPISVKNLHQRIASLTKKPFMYKRNEARKH